MVDAGGGLVEGRGEEKHKSPSSLHLLSEATADRLFL